MAGLHALAVVLALACLSPAARAHDLYTSWTDAYLRGPRLELTFTLARANALRLLPDSAPLPPITPENFASYAPKLKAIAPDLFAITLGGKPLPLTAAAAKATGDNDVVFELAYAVPAKPAGTLRILANYLRYIVDGHVGTVVVMDASGKDLGWSPVNLDQPVFELSLPPRQAGKPPTPRK